MPLDASDLIFDLAHGKCAHMACKHSQQEEAVTRAQNLLGVPAELYLGINVQINMQEDVTL